MSLVELMVAVAITGIILAMVVSFYTNQYHSYFRGKEIKKIQETNLDGAELLRRELSGAGWSVTPGMSFYLQDGGAAGSDVLWVSDSSVISSTDFTSLQYMIPNGAYPGSGVCAGGAVVSSAGPNTATVTPVIPLPNDFLSASPGNLPFYIIADTPANNVKAAQVTTAVAATGGLTLNGADPRIQAGGQGNLAGAGYVAPAVMYYIANSQLMRWDRFSGGAALPVANNVVDLQVEYWDTNANKYGGAGCAGVGVGNGKCFESPFDPTTINMIHLQLVTRSEDRVGGSVNSAEYCRPASLNHLADPTGSPNCGYLYRSYDIWVQPKNTQNGNNFLQ